MIIGVGIDIIEIDRIERAVKHNKNFLYKLFTEKEIEYFNAHGYKIESIAGVFAAKEAISKALGTGFRGFGFKDIEILKDNKGKPEVILFNKAKALAEIYGNYKVHLSISHNKSNAIAYAVMEVC